MASATPRRPSAPASRCSARSWTRARPAYNVGVLLRGTKRDEVERGQVVAKPGSIKPHTKFKAEGLRSDQGRRRPPYSVLQRLPPAVLLPDHRRDRRVRASRGRRDGDARRQRDHSGLVDPLPIAMEIGLRFAIREGGRTVGAGVVAEVIE